MAIHDRLLKGTFKGAEFLFKSISMQIGRKTVTHEFPNSDRRFVEDLGKLQKSFTITAIVGGPNYFENKNQLIEVLESKGPGILSVPTLGQVSVVAKPATMVEDDASLGELSLTMTFERSSFNVLPTETKNNKAKINKVKDEGLSSITDYINEGFEVLNKYFNFDDAADKLGAVSDQIDEFAELIPGTIDGVNSALTKGLQEFSGSISNFINGTQDIGVSLVNLFVVAEGIAEHPEDQFDFWEGLFSFGDFDTLIDPITQALAERKRNRDTINDAMQVNSLLEAYAVSTEIEFQSEEQLDDIRGRLETQFRKLDFSRIADDTGQFVKQIRIEARKFFDNAELTVAKIQIVEITVPTPAKVLSYQFYGDVERADEIIELNAIKSSAFVDGDIKVLTNATN